MFQENVATVSGKLNGLSGIADDPFVYGKSEKGYDQHILNVLDAAGGNNVRFNPDEVQFKVDQTSFREFTWTPRMDWELTTWRLNRHQRHALPQNLAEVQTFTGMVNYLNRFSPIIEQTSEPLRQLMKKDTLFLWQPEHLRAFQNVKRIIIEAPVLAYYDAEKDNVIQSDASLKASLCPDEE